MKAVFAYVHSDRVERIVGALRAAAFTHLTVVEVRSAVWPIYADDRDHLPQLGPRFWADAKLEVFCEDEATSDVVSHIRRLARAGEYGAASIYVVPVEQAIPVTLR